MVLKVLGMGCKVVLVWLFMWMVGVVWVLCMMLIWSIGLLVLGGKLRCCSGLLRCGCRFGVCGLGSVGKMVVCRGWVVGLCSCSLLFFI